jgi:hypothetical protein
VDRTPVFDVSWGHIWQGSAADGLGTQAGRKADVDLRSFFLGHLGGIREVAVQLICCSSCLSAFPNLSPLYSLAFTAAQYHDAKPSLACILCTFAARQLKLRSTS